MILFLTRIPPDPNGHGGSQRAMHLLKALRRLGPVDLMLVHRAGDRDSVECQTQEPGPFVRSYSRSSVRDWDPAGDRWPRLSYRKAMVTDAVTGYCADAPRVGRGTLKGLAKMLPARRYDLIFAGRLPCAIIADQMLRIGAIEATHKVVDFDDIMSRVGKRQIDVDGSKQGRLWKLTKTIECDRVFNAERSILRRWNATSVCSDDDVELLRLREPRADVVRIPNVVNKPRLPETQSPHPRLLFVGSLSHQPNMQGLRLFLAKSWVKIRARYPKATLRVVGMLPFEGLAEEIEAADAELHVSVPSVEPYYSDCDIVISPIFFGGGTRIKVLEAMGYGRPVVSTTIGAEGLTIVDGRHALIADDLDDMADACLKLCADPALRTRLADAAFALQQREFGPAAMDAAVRSMVVDHAGARPAELDAVA